MGACLSQKRAVIDPNADQPGAGEELKAAEEQTQTPEPAAAEEHPLPTQEDQPDNGELGPVQERQLQIPEKPPADLVDQGGSGDQGYPTTVALVTNNTMKWTEHRGIAKELGFDIDRVSGLSLPISVLQDPAEAVKIKAEKAFDLLAENEGHERPVLVEDLGLHFRALNGFPGANICIFHDKFGDREEMIANVLSAYEDKHATFRSAFCIRWRDAVSGDMRSKVFEGELKGTIVQPQVAGFQSDRIFVPEGHNKTLAALGPAEKRAIYSRRRAWERVRDWIESKDPNDRAPEGMFTRV